jgi:Icc-related predicted phosphoesterase
MRIYAAADMHAKKNHIDALIQNVTVYHPDIIILAGDITNYHIRAKTIARAVGRLDSLTVPLFCIHGNSDFRPLSHWIQTTRNVSQLSRQPIQYQDLNLIGINGTIPLPFHSKTKWWEKRHIRRIEDQITNSTILVSHPPPRGYRDGVAGRFSSGSRALKQCIENHPPLMVICGHIHEQSGIDYFKKTPIINCAMGNNCDGFIIDCDGHNIKNILQLTPEIIQ